jgi:hypothetical protein
MARLLPDKIMSDDTAPAPEKSPAATPRARRVSTPRPKKVAKSASEAIEPEAPIKAAAKVAKAPAPVAPQPVEEPNVPSAVGGEWPEPDAESAGGAPSQGDSAKRKRRRRKGKGQANNVANANTPAGEEYSTPFPTDSKPTETPQESRQRPQPAPQPQQTLRPKIDPELLTKMAWKIYLAEVSEEGVALIGDNDAKDLTRRCFRLAEIFIEEQSRRR